LKPIKQNHLSVIELNMNISILLFYDQLYEKYIMTSVFL